TPPPTWAADASLFSCVGCRCSGAAPSTHQVQGLLTSGLPAKHLPLAPLVPQKTVGSLPCPIVYRSQMPWLPCGSRFHMAHGRGVARLHHSGGGPLSLERHLKITQLHMRGAECRLAARS